MRIGILTGGGDCPGLNAVLRAAARAVEVDHGGEVVGFHDGWRGVLEDRWEPLTVDRCRGILPRGGTILGTSRDQPYQQADGPTLVGEAIDRHGLDAIVAIGGEGTMGVVTDLDRDGRLEVLFHVWTQKGSNQDGELRIVGGPVGKHQSFHLLPQLLELHALVAQQLGQGAELPRVDHVGLAFKLGLLCFAVEEE